MYNFDIHSTLCCFYANIHMLPCVKFKRSHHDPICHMKDLRKWHFWSKTDKFRNSKFKCINAKKASRMPCSANIHMLPMLPSVKFKRCHHDPICHMKDLRKWHFWSKTDTFWKSKVGKTRLKIKSASTQKKRQ